MFGRRRMRGGDDPRDELRDDEPWEAPDPGPGWERGPYDVSEAPEDGLPRLDLGSVRVPVPEGARLQVEVDKVGPVRAVHLLTPHGQLTVAAFAAPRSRGLWAEVRSEIATKLRGEGARVSQPTGPWGREVFATTAQVTMRFVGVDGPRWLVRGLGAGPAERADELAALLDEVLAGVVVDRGTEPMPVRSALPLRLPEHVAGQLKQAAEQQAAEQQVQNQQAGRQQARGEPGGGP